MSIAARHKKPGGFRNLVNSLETTPLARREQLMAILRHDDPQFLAHVETAIFIFDEFKSVNDMMVAELMHEMKNEMTAVALALHHCSDEELVQKFIRNMASPQAFAYRDAASELAQVTVGQQTGARFRIIEKARELQQHGRILLKKYSPLYQND